VKHNPLLNELRGAFPPVLIDATDVFTYSCYADAVEYRAQMHGKTWEQMDPQYSARRSDALSFMSGPHIAIVLPQYLHLMMVFNPSSPVPATLLPKLTKPEPADHLATEALSPSELFRLRRRVFDELTQVLSERQHTVVAATLCRFREVATAANAEDWLLAQTQRALDRYWGPYAVG
jgi:hypothetical protein